MKTLRRLGLAGLVAALFPATAMAGRARLAPEVISPPGQVYHVNGVPLTGRVELQLDYPAAYLAPVETTADSSSTILRMKPERIDQLDSQKLGFVLSPALESMLNKFGASTVEVYFVDVDGNEPHLPTIAAFTPTFSNPNMLYGIATAFNTVQGVEGNVEMIGKLATIDPVDPQYLNGNQWNLPQVKAVEAMNIVDATGPPKAPVRVAFIGSGITGSPPNNLHPDLPIIPPERQNSVVSGDPATGYTVPWGHETNAAGIVGALLNTTCVAGTTLNIELIDEKITNDDNCNGALANAAISDAIVKGADIIHIGCVAITPVPSNAMQASTFDAYNAGILVVAPTGNDGSTVNYSQPGRFDWVIGVGATDFDGSVPAYSTSGEQNVDVVAPGGWVKGIFSAVPEPTMCGGAQGTSFAGPHVAAAAANLIDKLRRECNSALDPDTLIWAIKASAVPNVDATHYGSGILDMEALLNFVETVLPPPPRTSSNADAGATVCYNDSSNLTGSGVVNCAPCSLESRWVRVSDSTPVSNWTASVPGSLPPVSVSNVTLSDNYNLDTRCAEVPAKVSSSGSNFAVSLTPSNVGSVQAGPDQSSYCAGDTMFVNKAATMYAGCSPCSLEYVILEGGSPVSGWGASPSLVLSAPGAHSYMVEARCVGEPNGREANSVPFGVSVLDNGVPLSVGNGLRVVKGAASNKLVLDTSLAPSAAGERAFVYGTVKLTPPPDNVVDFSGPSYVLTLGAGLQGKLAVSVDVRHTNCTGNLESPN
ncbi:MAG: S8 family serine peptidase [Nanoarchaeota archaeon]